MRLESIHYHKIKLNVAMASEKFSYFNGISKLKDRIASRNRSEDVYWEYNHGRSKRTNGCHAYLDSNNVLHLLASDMKGEK